jgi:uncharacterized membrane protein YciS (DUF1049 family)
MAKQKKKTASVPASENADNLLKAWLICRSKHQQIRLLLEELSKKIKKCEDQIEQSLSEQSNTLNKPPVDEV